MYPTTDEDEEQRILEEYLAMNQPALDELGGGAAPAQQLGVEALPAPMPEEDPIEAYAKMTSEPEGRPQTPWSSYDAPPQYKEKDNTMLWLAMGLDAVLNQGESVPQYLAQAAQPDTSAQKNWELRNKAMNDASSRAAQQAQAERARMQPMGNDLARQRWEAEQREKAALNSLDSPETQQWRKAAIAAGIVDEQTAAQMTAEQLKALRPQLGQAVSQERGFEYASEGRKQSDTLARRRMAISDAYATKRITYQDYLKQLNAIDEEEAKKTATETDIARKRAGEAIPGWVRDPNAGPLTESGVNAVKSTVVGLEKLRASVGKLQELRSQIGAEDMAQSKLGVKTPAMALAEQEVQNAANAIRQIANFGTPQAGEMAITYARVPEMGSLDSWINGKEKYEALLQSLESQAAAELKVHGYTRAPDGAAPSAPQPQRAPKRQPRVRPPSVMDDGDEPEEVGEDAFR